MIRIGIADCYGIESYLEKEKLPDKELFIFQIRADANRQRHAVLYVVDVTSEVDREMNKLLKDCKFDEALEYLKVHATSISFPANRKDAYFNSWKLIPDKRLDPWG
jgi:hypothetical protein